MEKKIGRPISISKSSESICINLAREGKLDREVADILNVSASTFHHYKNNNREFYESYRNAKAEFDDSIVEQALLKRAIGMSLKEVQIRTVDGKQIKTEITKEIAPDSTALGLYLRNRMPEKWCREKQNVNVEVETQQGLTLAMAMEILRNDPFAKKPEEVDYSEPSWLGKDLI